MLERLLSRINKSYERNNTFNFDLEHLYDVDNRYEFFDKLASDYLIWEKKYSKVIDESHAPEYKWFPGGKIKPLKNILTKHLDTHRRNKAALIWKGSDHMERIFTYQSLYSEVTKCASALKHLGVKHRDKIQLYMPNIPELIITMLACIKIGAIHSVYHHSYSAEAFAERLDDCRPEIVITSNTTLLGKESNMKEKLDLALTKAQHQPKYCIVVERTNKRTHMKPLRDIWYHDIISNEDYATAIKLEDAEYDANDTLFLLITSTNMNVPKALKYNTAGYLLWALYTYALFFDPADRDTFWCTADISWITGHTYSIYGPLMAGQTTVIFEDSLGINNAGRFYDILDKFTVNKVYTTPSILKSIMDAAQKKKVVRDVHDLELLAAGGEKRKGDVVEWCFDKLLHKKSPIIDICTLTEAGGAICGDIPGLSEIKAVSDFTPLPGVPLKIMDTQTRMDIRDPHEKGALMLEGSMPSLCYSICNGELLYKNIYWKKYFDKFYFQTGDGAEYSDTGDFVLTGRLDDVMHVGGRRVSLVEIEEALKHHELIKDAAVISLKDEKRGDSLVAFCVPEKLIDDSYLDKVKGEFQETILEHLGEVALPDEYKFTNILPKSPDGHILRDLLKEIAIQM